MIQKKQNKGFVLVHLMIAIFILGVWITLFGLLTRQYQMKITQQLSNIATKIEHRSMAYEVISLIAEGEIEKHLNETVIKRKNAEVAIYDESGKFNLNLLCSKDLERKKIYSHWLGKILKKLQVSSTTSRKTIKFIEAYGPFQTLDEIEPLRESLHQDDLLLRSYLTVDTDGKININTASKEILQVLLEDESPFLIKDIILKRQKGLIRDQGYVRRVHPDTAKILTTKSSFFEVVVRKGYPESQIKIRAVIQNSFGEFSVKQWIEK